MLELVIPDGQLCGVGHLSDTKVDRNVFPTDVSLWCSCTKLNINLNTSFKVEGLVKP